MKQSLSQRYVVALIIFSPKNKERQILHDMPQDSRSLNRLKDSKEFESKMILAIFLSNMNITQKCDTA